MAARWVGLACPGNKKMRSRAAARRRGALKDGMRALGAAGVLILAAGVNFTFYPNALAAVIGEHPLVSFIPSEPQFNNAAAAPIAEVDEADVRLLAATAWGEARSEGETGMRAVAHVMVNRIGPRFGEDLATVILSPKQFSVWNRGDPNRRLVLSLVDDPERFSIGGPEWEIALRVAREVLSGQSVDPTGGALFYHTRAVRPRWAGRGEGRQVIGAHIFYADVPDGAQRRTPRVIDVAQVFNASADRPEPRAGRVNGVIQHAPPETASPPTDANAAAAPTLNGVPRTQASPESGGSASLDASASQ